MLLDSCRRCPSAPKAPAPPPTPSASLVRPYKLISVVDRQAHLIRNPSPDNCEAAEIAAVAAVIDHLVS